ncbi:hypothetical protein OA56_07390 [Tepidiphilus sp. HLB4]
MPSMPQPNPPNGSISTACCTPPRRPPPKPTRRRCPNSTNRPSLAPPGKPLPAVIASRANGRPQPRPPLRPPTNRTARRTGSKRLVSRPNRC